MVQEFWLDVWGWIQSTLPRALLRTWRLFLNFGTVIWSASLVIALSAIRKILILPAQYTSFLNLWRMDLYEVILLVNYSRWCHACSYKLNICLISNLRFDYFFRVEKTWNAEMATTSFCCHWCCERDPVFAQCDCSRHRKEWSQHRKYSAGQDPDIENQWVQSSNDIN